MLPKRKCKIKCISKSNKYEGVILFIDNVESRKKVGTRLNKRTKLTVCWVSHFFRVIT